MVDGNGYAKLGDFGLAVKITKEGQSQVFAGTVGYQAPEII
jgi:serine/threonine protein kinase